MPPPSHQHYPSQSYPRHSILPTSTTASASSSAGSGMGNFGMSAAKTRQYAHLHSQLEQLNANLADTQNLLRMTAVQAEDMRFLGGCLTPGGKVCVTALPFYDETGGTEDDCRFVDVVVFVTGPA
ncbi:hypothetical protein ALT_1114 [Aspergillus lentulus]|uniref:Uncharacterized protein n=1 Tax=Aspergillus lentulus TaxID=293939 RepID=A0AAN4PCX3_ASPLE|nr:hypothetical protein CNMCM6069_009174 [Aspergillus lentulus]KAF4167538.1 hypothetical protein CNMCM6936_004802 [Aspergillus lentulus]KAF4179802.1 hypothetical protein CNMCM8060_002525 [Aspergillus lentulus]KAF4185535.1 hypothetical protein CNMCM7927_006479 [Aspergillus lentulus]KAF4194983.1 hypothetical protein CNMCM8694_006996 [Aspergillus lentulus]